VKKVIPMVAILILVALLLYGLPARQAEASPGWWDTNWQYRMKLTFDNSASSEDLDYFPVFVQLTSTHSSFWANINSSITTADTEDLRFVDDDDSTELYFEAEKIDYAGEDALIWVKVPQIDAGSTTDFIYVYYGSSQGESDHHSPNDVWDSNFKAVWHSNETSGSIVNDSTVNDNDGTPQNGVNLDAAGKIDGADSFDGTDDWTNLGTSSSLNFGANGPFTIEGWCKTTESYGTILSFRSSTDGGPVIDICVGYDGAVTSAGKLMALVRQDLKETAGYARKTGPTVNDDKWHYFALTRNAGNIIELFSDGITQGTASGGDAGGAITTNLRALGSERRWVQDGYGTADKRYLNGTIEEVRVSNTARSVDWIIAQYLSITDDFITYTNQPPNAPTGLGPTEYIDGSWGNNDTPTLEFTQSDPDSGNTVQYTIQIDDSSGFGSPEVDYTSELLNQGVASFTVGQAADGGWYDDGFEGQTLGEGEYYWRVRSIDESGVAGAWAEGRTDTVSFRLDTTAPTVVITSTATDPTNVSPIPMTATFGEDVTDFELGDITVGNGTADNFVAVSDAEYTFDVTPAADGLVTVDIAGGVAQDAASNPNTAAEQFTIAYDSTGQRGGSSDSSGNTKNEFRVNEDVLVTASGFLPDSWVDVYVVNDRAWTDGDSIPADVGDGMDTIHTDGDGNIGPVVIWSHPLKVGKYDIVFDAGQDGFYNATWDLVDHPNHPGFTVVSARVTVGGEVYPINKATILLP